MNKAIVICIALFFMSATSVTVKPKLYVVGDSTASIYASSLYPRTGWAQILQNNFIADSVEVVDKALSGRSSKSFFDEGSWTPIKNALIKGDVVIIQFGHNDEKTEDAARGTLPGSTFEKYLSYYIDDVVSMGATPILATPIERNSWSSTTVLKSTHITASGDYPKAIRNLAVSKKIGLIDATLLTKTYFEKIGKDSTNRLFMNLAAGESPNYPSGNSDNTYLQERGAKVVSQLIVNDIGTQKMFPLSAWIKGTITRVVSLNEVTGYSLSHHSLVKGYQKILTVNDNSFKQGHVDLSGRSVGFKNISGSGLWLRPNKLIQDDNVLQTRGEKGTNE